MRTITLEYDYNNAQALRTLEYILAMGLFNPTVKDKTERVSEKRKKLNQELSPYLVDLSGFKFNREEANIYE